MAASITTTSTTLEAQLLEIAGELQEKELAIPEAQRPNRVQIVPNTDEGTTTITAELPSSFVAIGGKIEYTATPYLA